MKFRFLAAAALLATLAFAPPAARAEPASGQPVNGIRCDTVEGSVFHIHQHVQIMANGKPVRIPADVGRPISGGCLYWIHTHSDDGLVHIEAPLFKTFTLGNFFAVWGEPLGAAAVGPARFKKGALRVYLNGALYKGDPRKIEMTQHADIALEAGPPYRKPAPFTDWKGQ